MYASYSKLSKELKNVIETKIDQALFLSYGSKQPNYCFDQ